MRKSLHLLILGALSSLCWLSANAQGLIQGTLLKSDGKPLPYTELEIVPPESKKIIVDSRLVSTSDMRGKFVFNNVPPGSYTLSVNFDDKPSQLAPYDAYFYPLAFDRQDAEILHIESGTRLRNIVFRMPPALTSKTINGRVVWEDGTPVKVASIGLWDLRVESSAIGTGLSADTDGRFKVVGFVGRKYQMGALAFDRFQRTPWDTPSHIIGFGETPPFVVQDSTNQMTIVVKPPSKADEDYWRRYIGF